MALYTASILTKIDTEANWQSSGLPLGNGELGIVTEVEGGSNYILIGDGTSAWNNLPKIHANNIFKVIFENKEYIATSGATGSIIINNVTASRAVSASYAQVAHELDTTTSYVASASVLVESEGGALRGAGDTTTPVHFNEGVPVACTPYESASVLKATRLENTAATGSATRPVYFDNGVPKTCSRDLLDSASYVSMSLFHEYTSSNESTFGGTAATASRLKNGEIEGDVTVVGTPNLGTSGNRFGNAYVGTLYASGDVIAAASSDRRLKEDIKTIEPKEADEVLKALNPVSFKWNKVEEELTEGHRKGEARSFIADEFLKVLPNAGQKIYDGKYDGIYIEQVIPYLVAGYQKQQREIEELREELKRR